MTSHFNKLRRFIRLFSILTPIFSFIAFLLYAREHGGLAILAGMLAFVCHSAFPHEKQKDEQGMQWEWKSLFCIQAVPLILIALWLVQRPGYLDFVEQVFSQDLWDWHLIAAAAIWHLLWIKSSYGKASAIEDKEIVEIYSGTNP
jgi:hypothetical protein